MRKKWFRQTRGFSSTTSSEHGASVERAACEFLCQQKLRCIAKNYRSPFGELDLIMRDTRQNSCNNNTLVFVEVRFRKHQKWGDGADSIDFRKQHKLIRTAEHFLQRHPNLQPLPCRFDVISVSYENSDTLAYKFHWIENAFSAD